jgi:hypothetical protein
MIIMIISGFRKNILTIFFFDKKVTNVLIAFTLKRGCDQTAIGIPPVTSAVFFIAKHFGKTWT